MNILANGSLGETSMAINTFKAWTSAGISEKSVSFPHKISGIHPALSVLPQGLQSHLSPNVDPSFHILPQQSILRQHIYISSMLS